MAIVSKKDVKNVKTNGEKEFFYVMKKMLPNASGRIITLPAKDQSITLSETYTFPGSYRLPLSAITNSGNYAGIDLTKEHTVEDFDNLAVVVFVQNNNTKEVMQAAWTAQDFPVGVEETIKNKQSNFVIYPNPANTYFEVVLENAKVAKVRVLDINGREVTSADITPDNSRIDCSSFNNGLYFVEIEVNGKATVQKLSIGR